MRTLAGAAAAVGGVPAAAILAMLATGHASAGAAIMALGATLAASLVVAALFLRDVELLAERLRGWPADRPAAALHVPPLEALDRAIEREGRARAFADARSGNRLLANEAILESLPDPLLVLNGDRSVRRANAAARKAFGAEIAVVLRHPGLRGAFDRALERRTAQTADLHFAVPVAREVQATVIWIDPPLDDGGVVFAVLSDRTRERAVERMRADFVANASHELRTPLASLIGFIDTLRGPAADDPPAQARFLGIMAEQAQRMNRLIDDLLSLSRIELTEHQPPSERVDLAGVVRGVAEAFEPRLRERGRDAGGRSATPAAHRAGDRDQIVQVLQNLVDNALKYGRAGGTVRLSAARPRWPPGGRAGAGRPGPAWC